ncbi:MAG: ParA family protein [Halopseudomonas yangmingensis]|uniref:Chromosome partitioning protein n=1 Tax=Halopseudomonas yangmingensis TaxID=1720063 RepID=A0A1I4NEQ1_9GAMM|nr:ParA family protein [Halopseudomonas yangmingensis]SFM13865.1 chromosome partitioning protein [Halopseudomonas yangmingensis]
MRVWAVANQKGGVGKTTSVVSLAGLLADQGQRVLLVDLDPHGSLTSYFGHDPDSLTLSVFNLFQHAGQVPDGLAEALLLDTSHENIRLIPASTALATLERQTAGQGGYGLVLSKSLAQLNDQFDFVLLDSPPLLGVSMINALAACEQLVIPVQTEHLALKGLERMISTLDMINRSRQQDLPYTIVPTLFDRRTQASLNALRVLRTKYAANLWQAFIPVDTKFRDASLAGVVPSRLEPGARGVLAYRALLRYLLAKTLIDAQQRTAEHAVKK